MEAKKIILVAMALILLAMPSFADITNYSVPDEMPLNQGITATGKSLDDTNTPHVNQLCSFYFLKASDGILIDRASDQYTDKTGRFAMPQFYLNEPDFIRGKTYTLKTICGSNEADQNFSVVQKQEAFNLGGFAFYPQAFVLDILYWTNPLNSTIFFLALLFSLALLTIWIKNFWG